MFSIRGLKNNESKNVYCPVCRYYFMPHCESKTRNFRRIKDSDETFIRKSTIGFSNAPASSPPALDSPPTRARSLLVLGAIRYSVCAADKDGSPPRPTRRVITHNDSPGRYAGGSPPRRGFAWFVSNPMWGDRRTVHT